MVNRPAGGARSQKWERSDYDWYVEPEWVVDQLFDQALGENLTANPKVVYDPFCGGGNILDVAKRRGFQTRGSDLVDRGARKNHPWSKLNFLTMKEKPNDHDYWLITNPPYSYERNICETAITKALDLKFKVAAFVVPIAFLCGQRRYGFFTERPPAQILFCSQRPTMPPGKLNLSGKGGMQDYVWIVYRRGERRTSANWLRPQ